MALDMTVRPILGTERTLTGRKTWIATWDDEPARAQILVGTREEIAARLAVLPYRVKFERRPYSDRRPYTKRGPYVSLSV